MLGLCVNLCTGYHLLTAAELQFSYWYTHLCLKYNTVPLLNRLSYASKTEKKINLNASPPIVWVQTSANPEWLRSSGWACLQLPDFDLSE